MFTKSQSVMLIAIAVGLTLIAVGCGSSAPSAPPPTPGQATVSFPIGVLTDSGSTFTFNADGTMVFEGGQLHGDGNYKVTGDQILFSSGNCAPYGNALYQWKYDGKTLSFTLIGSEPCGGRGMALRGVNLVKK